MLGIMAREPVLRQLDQRVPHSCYTLTPPPSFDRLCSVCFANEACVCCTAKCQHEGDVCKDCVRAYIRSRLPQRTAVGRRSFEMPTFPCITKGCPQMMKEADVFRFGGHALFVEAYNQQLYFKCAAARCRKEAEGKTTRFMSHVRRCPKCRVPVEKMCGCDQIKCTQCKASFCWECEADWDLVNRTDRRAHAKHCSHYNPRG